MLVAGSVAVAGCGGSSGAGTSSSTATSTPTTTTTSTAVIPGKAAFDSKLGSACREANAAFGNASSSKAKATAIGHFLTAARSIKAPAALRPLYSRYLTVIQQELTLQQRGNSSGLFRVASSEARPLAQQLGATKCLTG
jgi:hypothetical protein